MQITQLEISIPNLPPSFHNYRLLHLSDIHACSWLNATRVSERLSSLDDIEADLVVFTGDLAFHKACLKPAARALANLKGRDGLVAVLGNHDYWIGKSLAIESLQSVGARVLANESMKISRGDDSLYLVGVEDAAYLHRDDLALSLKDVPENSLIIVLSHAPDIILKPSISRASLILSGHTHGGQVVFPWIGPLYVPTKLGRKYTSGLLKHNNYWLFINRGLGEVFPPMRLNCPPEIALLTLRAQ